MNRLFAFAVILMLCLNASTTRGAQGSYTLDQVYAKLDQRSKSFHGIEANVVRTVVDIIVPDDKEITSGKFSYVRSGNTPRLMLEFTKPVSRFILIDKDLLQIYDPPLKRVQQKSIAANRDTVDEIMAIGFGQSGDDMKKLYEVTLVGDEVLDGQKTTVLDLKPKKISGSIKTIRLWIEQQQWISVQNKITAPSGDYSISKFTNTKLNGDIPDSRFKLNLPKDVTIVKL